MMDFGTYLDGRAITDDPEGVYTADFPAAVRKADVAPTSFPDFDAVEHFLRYIDASAGAFEAAENIFEEYMVARHWLSEVETLRRSVVNRTMDVAGGCSMDMEPLLEFVAFKRKQAADAEQTADAMDAFIAEMAADNGTDLKQALIASEEAEKAIAAVRQRVADQRAPAEREGVTKVERALSDLKSEGGGA